MNLPDYIREIGSDKAAKLFDETPRAIKGWLYRERTPRRETAQKIVKASKGKVSFADIYGMVE